MTLENPLFIIPDDKEIEGWDSRRLFALYTSIARIKEIATVGEQDSRTLERVSDLLMNKPLYEKVITYHCIGNDELRLAYKRRFLVIEGKLLKSI